MSRMDIRGIDTTTINISQFGGLNNAVQFSQIGQNQSPKLVNLIPGKTFGLRHRDGTAPFTNTPLGGAIARLPVLYKNGVTSILATLGTTLYKLNTGTLAWDAQTMTNALVTANIGWAQFRDDSGSEVLVIADGGNLKSYNGTAVTNITPATDGTSPLPPNGLATINSGSPAVGVTVHNNRLVVWPAGKDIIFHSNPGFFDYFPKTFFQRFVRDNDTVVTCRSFASALVVFMKRHLAVVFGDGYSANPSPSDWSQDFLDTTDGCVNGRSVQQVIFPDGREELFYQTDRGVSAVITLDTKDQDNSTRLATRRVTENKVDWNDLGITNAEWAAAASYFRDGEYWLVYKQGAVYKGLVFNTTNEEWYPVENVNATDFYSDIDRFYFASNDGHLKNFDTEIHRDFTDHARTAGPNVAWYWYSKLMTPGLTGYDHLWDELMVEAQQFNGSSTIDVEVNTVTKQYSKPKAIKTQILIIGVSIIGESQIANNNLTDIINNAKRIRTFLKGQYAQIKLSSDRGEPVEILNVVFEVRPQTKY